MSLSPYRRAFSVRFSSRIMPSRTTHFRQIKRPLLTQNEQAFTGRSFRSFASTSALCRVGVQEMGHDAELFEYSSGRWIYNENLRLAQRRLIFNLAELMKAAADSINKPESDVKSIQKLAEGGFNRIFEITMRDETSVLARMPYPSTLPRRLAVASEVATMDFVRAHGVPTPRILGYAIGENPVGSEYILMEKLPGRTIGDAWFDLSEQQRLQILHDIVKLESKLFSIQLPASGSIYYARDLEPDTPRVEISGTDGQFCVGPYAELGWWYGKREKLEIDRGPHVDTLRALRAPAEKELTWIREHGKPRYPCRRQYREAFNYMKQDPIVHAESLQRYLHVAPHLIPTSPELNFPVLRHPDMQPNNIFISENYRVTSLIDWQHATALPTFLAAGIPNSFQNYGDAESRFFAPPRLPTNLDSLSERLTQRFNQQHWRALEEETDILRRRIFDHAGEPWEGVNTALQYDLVQVSQNWDKIVPLDNDGTAPTCPVSFTQEEAERIDALDDLHRDADGDVEKISELLGVASDGWTPEERFESAMSKLAEIREQALASVDDDPWLREMSERHWPFDDYDEDE
ncbi:phosphotransferase enzyme family [Pyrenophora seminiperda CCB06]|uniref:Phosphotransferase enzyme family n=1 Tax=Pyrenophora seminiperda CCB06 TaxID=1302712 RepID=A0A3M7M2U6_9PLEO|nr:phosphotransferase enzyme family [Pyrenophora seminiperda CCB06]